MKKVYVKPEIELESFMFSANIAGECKNPSEATGETIYENGFPVEVKPFSGSTDSCTVDEGGFCLHVPTADTKVWMS